MIRQEAYWTSEIGKFLSGNADDRERDALMDWLETSPEHRDLFDKLEQVWTEAQVQPIITDQIEKDRYWKGIASRIDDQRHPRLRQMYLKVAAVAAVALLAFTTYQWITPDAGSDGLMAEVIAESATEEIVLPDGSLVWLREGSSLTYDPDFNEREVQLRGEGYFEIAHDPERKFVVAAGKTTATVLGTKFNLRSLDDGAVELYVTEGKVALSKESSSDNGLIVTRDQVAVTYATRVQPELLKTQTSGVNRLSWKTRQLVFDHVDLEQVIEDLEHYFRKEFEIVTTGLGRCELKADFTNADLPEVIETLEFGLNTTVEHDNGVYRISGEPCDIPVK